MHIQTLKIQNFRCFETATVEFNLPDTENLQYPNVNVLLGDNGLGKTSVLRAVALAVLSPLLSGSSGFVPAGFIRQHPRPQNAPLLDLTKHEPTSIDAGIISTVEEKNSKKTSWSMPERYAIKTSIRALSTSERLTWNISPKTSIDAIEHMQFDEQSPAFFIVGYGATRRVESSSRVDESARTKSRARRYERVASLFEDHVTLMPLSYWLPAFAEQNKGRYTQVINLINDLLPAKCKIQKTATQTQYGREHLFEINGIALPFGALSDGFRAYIGWIGDMLFHVCQGVASGLKLREMRGIVMVDEIDLHLHPEWQRSVVPTLAKALPNVQFILTTHSPLVVGSLMSQNLFVLAEENGSTIVKRLPEHVRGKSAEQILLSPYFGLESTRATPTATALSQLARSAVSGNTKASVDYLRILAEGMSFEEMAGPDKPKATAARRAPKKPSRPAK
ncbi:AAA family ATPase [Pseudomonas sp. CT11-2]|uniref:AAA family ATPase n=1 Tax=unclassified Pseudomonas TaxID=196821 RepID=UPI00215ECFF2|nr:ATP-binding protein [Pseudomonas sp. B21-019]UVM31740.1 AAA family ATPase [Pseudomonas sp. B21-019]